MTTEADGPVQTERRGAALWLWLNRPNALNSLTLKMVHGEVDSLVAAIAGKSPAGIAAMKALIDDGLQVPREVGLRMERQRAAAHTRTHDFHEGVSAFTEKRAPKFTGR